MAQINHLAHTMTKEINPLGILSGKVVKNHFVTFYFKEPGNNVEEDGFPIYKNLHRDDGPAWIYYNGSGSYFINGIHCSDT